MTSRSKLWRFALPLRLAMIAVAAIYGLYYLLAWGLAFAGDFELAYDFVDVISTAPLSFPQIFGGMVMSAVPIIATILIAFTANRLLRLTQKDGFFVDHVSRDLRRLGQAMIMFWLGLYLIENILPAALTSHLTDGQREVINYNFLDINLVALFVGFLLLLLAEALDEARAIDAENKQII